MSEEEKNLLFEAAARTRWLETYRTLDLLLPRASPTSLDVQHARRLIDAELAGVHLLASALNERRNELALPALLPPEVLALIFNWLAAIYPMSLQAPGTSRRTSLGWVTVSHVCRRWRSVILDQPSLWAHLTPDGQQPWKTFLDRAKEVALFVKGPLKVFANGETRVPFILDHRHHIEELVLSDIRSPQLQALAHGLDSPWQRLRVLSLSRSPGGFSPDISLPAGLLTDYAPDLEELILYGIRFPWGEGSRRLKKLVYQQPTTRSYGGNPPPSYDHTFPEVLQTLRQMPSLRILKLVNALPDITRDSHPEAIALPLEELCITNSYDTSWHLWSQLRLPSSVSLDVQSTSYTAVESLILSTYCSHLEALPTPTFTALSIHVPDSNPGTIRLNLWRQQEPDEYTHAPAHNARPSVALQIPCRAGAASLAQKLIGRVVLEDIRDLTYSGGRIGESEIFRETFLRARSVTDLTIKQQNAGTYLIALGYPTTSHSSSTGTEKGSPSTDDGVLFPELRTLTCTDINFSDYTRHTGGALKVLHRVLGEVLGDRDEHGSTLATLTIEGCDVVEEWIGDWDEVVGEVDWDSDEGLLEERDEEEEGENEYYGFSDYDDWPY
ncbi:unnamed protein product [Peniophora sp. CBMAI 1063]|nr:unnamed protein product [Peniophora sp. CBMAI 1063]